MPKGKRGKKDWVEVKVTLRGPKLKIATMSRAEAEQIIRHWSQTNKLPTGFSVVPEWRNPNRPGTRSGWRTGESREAVDTLFRRFLPHANLKRI